MNPRARFVIGRVVPVFLFFLVTLGSSPALALEVGVADFEAVTGIQPAGDLGQLAMAATLKGSVVDPEKVKALGYKGQLKAGDEVEIFRQSNTSVTLSFPKSNNPFPVIVNIKEFK
jgi:hypothetical protein